MITNDGGGKLYRLLISDIKEEGSKSFSPFGAQPISIFTLADTTKDVKTMLKQDFGGSPSNAGGNAGNDY
jgi:hypothetical protein